ncbi:MAG: hypothetical protein ACXW25_06870, partial [Rhodospirillales bacterium]
EIAAAELVNRLCEALGDAAPPIRRSLLFVPLGGYFSLVGGCLGLLQGCPSGVVCRARPDAKKPKADAPAN